MKTCEHNKHIALQKLGFFSGGEKNPMTL